MKTVSSAATCEGLSNMKIPDKYVSKLFFLGEDEVYLGREDEV
jgi:hypothetical protein